MSESGPTPVHMEDIAEIARCLSPTARLNLRSYLGELFHALENLEDICDVGAPQCRSYLSFPRLHALLVELNTGCAGE